MAQITKPIALDETLQRVADALGNITFIVQNETATKTDLAQVTARTAETDSHVGDIEQVLDDILDSNNVTNTLDDILS